VVGYDLDDVMSWRNWFQSLGAASLKDRSVNLSLESTGGRTMVGVGPEVERVRPGGWRVRRVRK
jgi:hypothetical protein